MKQHQQRPLAVGDLCTTKSKFPENAGMRVVVTAHVPGRRFRGKLVQYSIQRIDGSPHPLTTAPNGSLRRNSCKIAVIGRSQLVRIDLDGEDHRDKLVAAPLDWLHITDDQLAALTRDDEIEAARGGRP